MSIDAFPPSIATTTTDDTLDALAGLSTSANTMPYFTGVDLAALTPLTPFMRTLLDDPDLATAQATLGITGGGGGAPTDAEYIVGSAHGTLTQERVLTTTPTVAWDLATAGQAKASVPDASITEVKISFSDVTSDNATTGQHGLLPKLSGVATQYLDGTGLWTVPPAGTTYTDEQAQDAVGAMLVDTATIDLTYGDGGPTLQADVKDLSITEAKLTFVDVTTKDATTSVHGLLRKLSGTATQYLDGSGAWTTPAGGTNYWSRVDAGNTLLTAFAAFWRLEEASGTRLDSVGSLAMVPIGGANLTQVTGKIGQAAGMNGTSGTYLTLPSAAAVQMSIATSVTVMAWVYLTSLTACAYVSKGDAGVSATYEYVLALTTGNRFRFGVANGSAFQVLDETTFTPSLNTWYCLIGWYDAALATLNLQVNNGTVRSVAATNTAYASAYACEIGRHAGWSGSPSLNGRIDLVGIGKRVLTSLERTALYNAGTGLDYPFGSTTLPYLTPVTSGDTMLLGATRLTNERLEVDGAIKVGTTTGTTDGIVRWTGTDMEARKGGTWVSMTSGAGGQPLDATLTALAGLATGADQLPYATGTDTFAQTPLTTFARTLLDDTTQAAMRTTLGLTPGTDVQVQDAELQAIAGLTSAADRLPYFTGLGTAALAPFTAAGRTLAGAADAAAQRGALALGTMATQNADAVAMTGGTAALGAVGLGGIVPGAYGDPLDILYDHMTQFGIGIRPTTESGGGAALNFSNSSGAQVGTIQTTASATSYNTSSDARLKHAITALTGALDVVQALRPVRFRWNADDSVGHGFLAHDLQQVVPEAVTGLPDEVNEDGSIKPQGVDHSRLVPWLTAALQETLAQVQALTARVVSLEEQLGV